MLRRLLVILVPFAVVLVMAVLLPLGTMIAQQYTQDSYVDRTGDAGRFASLAQSALEAERLTALDQELERYHDLYETPVIVVAPDGGIITGSQDTDRLADLLDSLPVDGQIRTALAGERPQPPNTVWPWTDDPLVVVEPVGRDSEVAGAVVLVSPTDRLGSEVLDAWTWTAVGALVPLALLVAAALPLSRWVLRPIRRLDEATEAVSSGDLEVSVDAERGPPELRDLTYSFNTMVSVVRGALERQRAFVSEASHQLRNPLASLRLAVENLAPHLRTEDAREAHAIAVDEATVMHRMLDSLLAATRLESITGSEPVDVPEVLSTRVDRWRALGDSRGIEVETDVPDGLRVLAPAGGLGSILDELVSNATRLSGGTRIVVRAREDDPARLWVLDDGQGLPEDEREPALHRFWRSTRHQNTEGTGLGLAIVADLVRDSGGRLSLTDGVGEGDRPGFGVLIELPPA